MSDHYDFGKFPASGEKVCEWGDTDLGPYQIVTSDRAEELSSVFYGAAIQIYEGSFRVSYISCTFAILELVGSSLENGAVALRQSQELHSLLDEYVQKEGNPSIHIATEKEISAYFAALMDNRFNEAYVFESVGDKQVLKKALIEVCDKNDLVAEFFSLFTKEGRQAVIDADQSAKDLANRFQDFPFVAL